jgi:hypothetical protein
MHPDERWSPDHRELPIYQERTFDKKKDSLGCKNAHDNNRDRYETAFALHAIVESEIYLMKEWFLQRIASSS